MALWWPLYLAGNPIAMPNRQHRHFALYNAQWMFQSWFRLGSSYLNDVITIVDDHNQGKCNVAPFPYIPPLDIYALFSHGLLSLCGPFAALACYATIVDYSHVLSSFQLDIVWIFAMPAVRGDGMRGLAVFISDIRNCKSKEAEIKRINKELANIRSKFKVCFHCLEVGLTKHLHAGRQNSWWLPEEKVCLQTPLHLPPRSWHWLWPDWGCQPPLIQQVHRETDCEIDPLF